ncbi:MAG: bifunctional folylpolyglutamate synthase/dihydrofolate synthase [Tannerellaceae bacterium]|jgi:dihydrofolate synthase/folylpolyglutamate synthase|nr:bifunctional folylpolyglutamate synthase/dihydrofolate synthase [Tannerellaceae bacterium]
MAITYSDTLNYLFASTAVFERDGIAAYKPGLDRIDQLTSALGNPHNEYEIIHVAGTNGKGTVCHTLAAILQESGLRTGLYTSPHLVDFSERIRVNGKSLRQKFVVDFVRAHGGSKSEIGRYSFFELTTAMAFDYFREMKVDVAVVETGLGGRYDSTNIVRPILSIITSISLDHTDILGTTLEKIAAEKAGIIKQNVPVVIGGGCSSSINNIFIEIAEQKNAPIFIADQIGHVQSVSKSCEHGQDTISSDFGTFKPELKVHNARTILTSLTVLKDAYPSKYSAINTQAIAKGFANVRRITGLRGRWEEINFMGRQIVVDIAHNIGAWNSNRPLIDELVNKAVGTVHIIVGFCKEKTFSEIFTWLPETAGYHFVTANTQRAMPAGEVAEIAKAYGRIGKVHGSVIKGVLNVIKNTKSGDIILISGSAYVAGEALSLIDSLRGNEGLPM